MDAYNLIGTLIELEPTKPIYEAIRTARVKHQPKRDFIIVTSQVVHPGHRAALNALVRDRFDLCKAVIFTDKKRKPTTLNRLFATSYTDFNDQALTELHAQQPALKLYKITRNRARIPFNG
jgi:hypothetical protein